MSIEEYVQNSREEKRQMFGKVEAKTDCKNYRKEPATGNETCALLKDHSDYGGSKPCLECTKAVCYFYDPEWRKDDKENG